MNRWWWLALLLSGGLLVVVALLVRYARERNRVAIVHPPIEVVDLVAVREQLSGDDW